MWGRSAAQARRYIRVRAPASRTCTLWDYRRMGSRQFHAPLAAGRRHSVAVGVDGTVLTAGTSGSEELRTTDWRGIVAVAAGNVHTAPNTGRSHTAGLRNDGTVLATGWNNEGQCDVHHWEDVVSVAAGWRRTLADQLVRPVVGTREPATSRTGATSWPSQQETGTPSASEVTARSWWSATVAGGSATSLDGVTSARSRRATCTPPL